MSQIRLGGYRGAQNVLTTELNTLAAATGKAVSAAQDNSANLDLWADFELTVTFASAPVLNSIVELFILPSLDGGTTYADGSSTVVPSPQLYAGGFAVRAVTTAQRLHLRGLPLPPGFYKLLVQNTTAQPFPASGSVLTVNAYGLEVV